MNANHATRMIWGTWTTAIVACASAWLATGGPGRVSAGEPGRVERLSSEVPDAPPVEGRLVLGPGPSLRFQAAGEPVESARPIAAGREVRFGDDEPSSAAIPALFQVRIGESARISGMLLRVAETDVELSVPWRESPIVARRPGVQSLVQRFGEARILVDAFDALDAARWSVNGKPSIIADAGPSPSDRGLVLPPGGTSIEHRFEEPLSAGRIDLTFRDDGKVRPDQEWTLDLTLRAATGPASIRVVLGWSEESLAVESPAGPTLAVQRLARGEGWRRLAVRFDADRTEIAVDGKELAHGKGPPGPLESIRVATSGPSSQAAGRGAVIGEVQVSRFAEPPSSLEIDPTQDEARLIVGDQLYGTIGEGDADHLKMVVDDRGVVLDWGELSGVYFKRTPAEGEAVQGALARVEWRAGAGDPAREPDFDFAEGAVTGLSENALTLATPYAGALTIPRERLLRVRAFPPGWRQVVDPTAHHLGNEITVPPLPVLDPPHPEGGVLERSFTIPEGIDGPKYLVLDVVHVVGETPGLEFSEYISRGELKTYVAINGARIDYLNRYIDDANETPRRIRIPIAEDRLKPGRNQVRIEQTGMERLPMEFDDLGILGIAVEAAVAERPSPPIAAPIP